MNFVMRAVLSSFLFIALTALAWTLKTPITSFVNVNAFASGRADVTETEEALVREGHGAIWFLQNGLKSSHRQTRMHSAKVLMILGESQGESFLLNELRTHRALSDGAGRQAEALLLAAWDRRDGPNESYRKRLREVEHQNTRMIETLNVLNESLLRYPNWADGYARRARLYQQAGEVYEAKRDAIAALACAPNHFEAIITLGRVQMSVEASYFALKCFERAILINPRMKSVLKSEMDSAMKAIDVEKEKHRDEKRKNAVLVLDQPDHGHARRAIARLRTATRQRHEPKTARQKRVHHHPLDGNKHPRLQRPVSRRDAGLDSPVQTRR